METTAKKGKLLPKMDYKYSTTQHYNTTRTSSYMLAAKEVSPQLLDFAITATFIHKNNLNKTLNCNPLT